MTDSFLLLHMCIVFCHNLTMPPRSRLPCSLLRPLPLEITGRLRVGTLPHGATGGPNLARFELNNLPPDDAVNPSLLGGVTVDGVSRGHDGAGHIVVEAGRTHFVGDPVRKLLLDRGLAHTGRRG